MLNIGDKLLKLSDANEGNFIDELSWQTQAVLDELGKAIEIGCFLNSFQSRGIIGTVSTTRITLATPEDSANFQKGDYIQVAATDGGALRTTSGVAVATLAIDSIDRVNGYLNAASNWGDTINGIQTGDYITLFGDGYNNGATNTSVSSVGITGLAGICPTAPATTGTLHGADWTKDSLLSGIRYLGTSDTMEEAVLNGIASGEPFGMSYDYLSMNPGDYRRLVNSMSSKAVYEMVKGTDASGDVLAHLGFKVLLMENTGIVRNRFCPKGIAWGINSEFFELGSAGAVPSISGRGGINVFPHPTEAGYQSRFMNYMQLVCRNPAAALRITLPTGT